MSSHRERIEGRRGFALVTALVLALLFFALIELVLADSAAALRTAERVRGRVLADILAENGVELVAEAIVSARGRAIDQPIEGGRVHASSDIGPEGRFTISSEAVTDGVFEARASVDIEGQIDGDTIRLVRSKTRPGSPGPPGAGESDVNLRFR